MCRKFTTRHSNRHLLLVSALLPHRRSLTHWPNQLHRTTLSIRTDPESLCHAMLKAVSDENPQEALRLAKQLLSIKPAHCNAQQVMLWAQLQYDPTCIVLLRSERTSTLMFGHM
jgi:hypothetical protein